MNHLTWTILLFFTVTLAHGASITGRVVGVHDGDTLTVLTPAKQQIKVRLYGIDAPEAKQAFGSRGKQELSALAFGKSVRVEIESKDRYGRTVARVFVGITDVNAEMVRRGFAWWYRSYAKKDVALAAAETEAKNAGRGLWADKTAVAPWDFRKNAAAARVSSQVSR
jgi:endonuclease YncB( thermonuclease family)